MVYSRAEYMFILEHYFASKSFAAVREAFKKAYPVKKMPSKYNATLTSNISV